jgi:isocitrate/isopropylmalate dehydrogenase
LRAGHTLTPDLGGKATTTSMTAAILEAMHARVERASTAVR